MNSVIQFFSFLLDRFFLILGAFLGSQVPEFIQQYVQQLSGRAAELQFLMHQIELIAKKNSSDTQSYIDKFVHSDIVDNVIQGQFMNGILDRAHTLQTALIKINQANFWTKPFIFLEYTQNDVLDSTLSTFQPSISLTWEGAYCTFLGICIIYGCYQCLLMLCRGLFNKSAEAFKKIKFKSE